MTTKTLTKQDVVSLVRRYVEANQPPDFQLDVIEEGVRFSSQGLADPFEWWYVVVVPRDETVEMRRSDYNDTLYEIEAKIEAEQGLFVSLLPTLPGD